jgi:hypothetical protein
MMKMKKKREKKKKKLFKLKKKIIKNYGVSSYKFGDQSKTNNIVKG